MQTVPMNYTARTSTTNTGAAWDRDIALVRDIVANLRDPWSSHALADDLAFAEQMIAEGAEGGALSRLVADLRASAIFARDVEHARESAAWAMTHDADARLGWEDRRRLNEIDAHMIPDAAVREHIASLRAANPDSGLASIANQAQARALVAEGRIKVCVSEEVDSASWLHSRDSRSVLVIGPRQIPEPELAWLADELGEGVREHVLAASTTTISA